MKLYIKSSTDFEFPEYIEIKMYPNGVNPWVMYKKTYEHEGGGCYYDAVDPRDREYDAVSGTYVSLYPDGRLTYLWNGRENPLNREWR